MRGKYIPPELKKASFNCPHCGALANQAWFDLHAAMRNTSLSLDDDAADAAEALISWSKHDLPDDWHQVRAKIFDGRPCLGEATKTSTLRLHVVSLSRCFSCKDVALWIADRIVWPVVGAAPAPNLDLPNHIRQVYEEASAVLDTSPRGAAALLRLSVEMLLKNVGAQGKTLNDKIGDLVRKGLRAEVQQALDVVRFTGNNMVHPGQIDLKDDRQTAACLFDLVNDIAEDIIGRPKRTAERYGNLPKPILEGIERRDGPKTGSA